MNVSRKVTLSLVIAVLLLIVGGIAFWNKLGTGPKFSGPPEKIRLGTIPAEYSALIWLAQDLGYFRGRGLDVVIKQYESGFAAVMDLLADKLDIATCGEFVLVAQSFQRQDFRVLANIDRYDVNRVVARKDRDISQLPDLRGKRIGVLKGSQGEFCLAGLLILNSIPFEAVKIVDLSPSQQMAAIEPGEIDAAVTWEPFISKIKKKLGSNAVILPAQSGQDLYWLLACKQEIMTAQPALVQRLLSALLEAEEFVARNEAEAKVIVARRLSLDMPYLESIWMNNQFKVTLPQALLLTIEDQAKWMMSAGLTKKSEIPNFLDLISLEALKNLKPEAVGIFH
jgi:ABC-type nitrate/sulfonate/bicarbonate transport system substrate-binding protein